MSYNWASIFDDESYAREGNFGTDHRSVENDEIIARTLHEEFSGLAIAEASCSSHVRELRECFLAGDSFASYIRHDSSGNEGDQEEADDSQSFGSSSWPDEDQHERGKCLLEATDDSSSLDSEVEKRLNQMVPSRHVPKINGEIPSDEEVASDHQRIMDRLRLYGLVELQVQGDGNCQFRALSDQLYRTPEYHKFVREQVINQLSSYPEIYEEYVPMEYGEYLNRMSKSGEWGDHVTLQAAADSYGVKIFIITSFKDTCYIEILPNIQKSTRIIFLSFWAEVHYNSFYPEGELPPVETKKEEEEGNKEEENKEEQQQKNKKRWWHFGKKH